MKKYILLQNAMELLEKLLNGKRVEGVLYIDGETGKLTFKAYNRTSRKRLRDRLVCKLEHGWVKESLERIKVYESVPKDLGTARICKTLERETKVVEDVLMDQFHIDMNLI